MLHNLFLSVPFEDEHKPVMFPFYTVTDDERLVRGEHVALVINGKSIPTIVQSLTSRGHTFEIVLDRA
jgi:hypothetical protein